MPGSSILVDMSEQHRLISLGKLARDLDMHENTLRRWRVQGRLPAAIKIGPRYYFDRAELSKWLESQKEARPVAEAE